MKKVGMDLLKALLERGDEVGIERGKLVIYPKSGKSVPDRWMKCHRDGLVTAILTALNLEAYKYISFTTGFYGLKKSQGVTLRFASHVAGKEVYGIFNAYLTRARTTKTGRKGSPLPGKEFRISERHHLYKFWLQTGLRLPKRLSGFSEYMGNLKSILFSASVVNGRMDAASVRPLCVRCVDVRAAFLVDKEPTTHGQHTDKTRTRVTDKGSTPAQTPPDLQPSSGACAKSRVNTLPRKRDYKGTVIPFPQDDTPQYQSVDDWVAEFRAPRGCHSEHRGGLV